VSPGERSTVEPEAVERDRPEPEPGEPPPPSKARRRGRFLVETLVIVVVALLVAVLLRTFVIQTFYVPSGSMEPTIQIGDRILVDKLSYHFHSVHRGDIIVFKTPPAENCGGPAVPDLVKRVIGLPGNRISSRGNTVYINGKPLAEPWLPANEPLGKPITPMTVPKNEYYVMGDNRPNSCDSRYWGPVARSLIVGKVVAIFWPPSRLHWF
jgi:signal peptidase I